MKIIFAIGLLILLSSFISFAQKATVTKPAPDKTVAAVASSPIDIAKAAVAAHGGDKLKNMKSLLLRGSVEVNGGSSMMVIPATFMLAISGDKYVFELNNPIQPLKQISDGKDTSSSGYQLPPMTSLGFPLLMRVGQTGYVVAALPQARKSKKGFRITTAEGFYTDFFVDEKLGQIKGYESAYDVDGRTVTTSVEIDEFQTVEGVIVPKRYSQRFDLGQMTAYANFKTKDILVNSQIEDSVFAISK